MKYILTILVVLCLASPAMAGGWVKVIDAAEFDTDEATTVAAATGASLRNSKRPYAAVATDRITAACEYVDSDSGISAVTAKIQGSVDDPSVSDANATWYDLHSHDFDAGEITAKAAMWHSADKTIRRFRVNVTTMTGVGSDDTITCWMGWME